MNSDQQRGTSREQKQKANQQLGKLERDVKGYNVRCLFVVDDSGRFCNEPVSNRCHIVSNSQVLSSLRNEQGKVYELQWGISQWRRLLFKIAKERRIDLSALITFDPSRVPTDDACTGRFACKQHTHDDEFKPIDIADPDFDDAVVRFLSGHRLVLFLVDQYRLALELLEERIPEVMRGSDSDARKLWLGGKAELERGLCKAESTAVLLGKTWHAHKTTGTFDHCLVSAEDVEFRSKLHLAGGVFYGHHGRHCAPGTG